MPSSGTPWKVLSESLVIQAQVLKRIDAWRPAVGNADCDADYAQDTKEWRSYYEAAAGIEELAEGLKRCQLCEARVRTTSALMGDGSRDWRTRHA